MSHYMAMVAQGLEDIQLTMEALNDMGVVAESADSLTLSGWGNVTIKAQIAIRKGSSLGNRYDAGFQQTSNGLQPIIEDMDKSRFPQSFFNRLQQAYTKRQSLQIARKEGFHLVRETRQENGAVRLHFAQAGR